MSEALALLVQARGDRRDTVARPVGAPRTAALSDGPDGGNGSGVRDDRSRSRSPQPQRTPSPRRDRSRTPVPRSESREGRRLSRRDEARTQELASGRPCPWGADCALGTGCFLHSGQGSSHGAHEAQRGGGAAEERTRRIYSARAARHAKAGTGNQANSNHGRCRAFSIRWTQQTDSEEEAAARAALVASILARRTSTNGRSE